MPIFASVSRSRNMTEKKFNYRKATEEIQALLGKIENDEIDINDLTKAIKRAAELLQNCKEELLQTEEEVEKIIRRTKDD
jgi:exodeoxyribonuclease VII small subunit